MNSKIQKVYDEIERTKAKITELQAALPILERKRTELENSEIIRLFRSADLKPEQAQALFDSAKISANVIAPDIPIQTVQKPPERAAQTAVSQNLFERNTTEYEEN